MKFGTCGSHRKFHFLKQKKETNLHKILLSFALLMLSSQIFATILRVSGDGSQGYVLIQNAIAQSCDGDTVLVYPGRYYENLSMMGKNITLASLELTTGNQEYKHSTTIDGNQTGSVIIIQNGESDVTIRGFTITNGSGWYIPDLGMSIGGGIQIGGLSGNRNVNLINNVICRNNSDSGGGVFISTANVFLSGSSIFNNVSRSGGGVRFENTISGHWSLSFDPVNRSSIYSNLAALGSDLFTYHKSHTAVIVDTFTVAKPWNFYACGIAYEEDIINPFSFDILNTAGHQEINQDLYVAPWGSDDNSGTSPQDPFQTIFKASYMIASDSQNPKTIYLAEGVYSQSLNNQMLPAPVKTNTSLLGVSEELTIIDGDGQFAGVIPPFHSENTSISQITFRNSRAGIGAANNSNASMTNLRIHDLEDEGIVLQKNTNTEIRNVHIDNVSGRIATGIIVDTSKQLLEMDNVSIRNVSSDHFMRAVYIGGWGDININRLSITNCSNNNNDEFAANAIMQISPSSYAQRLKVNITNSLFADNYQAYGIQHMMFVIGLNESVTFQNCTFAGNLGGRSVLGVAGTVDLINNIFWNPDLPYEIELPFLENGSATNLTLEHNNIRGGANGLLIESANYTIDWVGENQDADPIFRGRTDHPYSLLQDSPMIDTGSSHPSGIELGWYDLAANERYFDGDGDGRVRIDIGAYEYQNMPRPTNLDYQELDNAVALNWEMPHFERALTGFRVYRDGVVRAELDDATQTHYVDSISMSGTYRYFITAMYGLLESDPSESVEVYIEAVANEDPLQLPAQFSMKLEPNPFKADALIRYAIPQNAAVKLEIYNLKGQLIRRLVNDHKSSGSHQVTWDGRDQAGSNVVSGLYFVRLQTNGRRLISKIVKLQ